MASTAALVSGFRRWLAPNLPGPLSGGSLPGTTILPNASETVTLVVELALGADLSDADGDSWNWTDVTSDVLQANDSRITLQHGKLNEARTSQPATCRLVLDNREGRYSLGGQSPNYPHIKRNVPVRVRVAAGGAGFRTLFQGYADTWAPSWDTTGNYAVVNLTASGVLRRLIQGDAPVKSALRRATETADSLVAYWPIEGGRNATTYPAASANTAPMALTGDDTPTADSTSFDCSDELPVSVAGTEFTAGVPAYTASDGLQQVRFLLNVPSGTTDGAVLAHIEMTGGTLWRWDITFESPSSLGLYIYDNEGILFDSTTATLGGLVNDPIRLSLDWEQDGADITWTLGATPPNTGVGFFAQDTITSETAGTVDIIHLNPQTSAVQAEGITYGHLSVQSTITSFFEDYDALGAHVGEASVSQRMPRLTSENDLSFQSFGGTSSLASPAELLGPQTSESLVDLLREGEAVDNGILWDGVGAGCAYTTRRRIADGDILLTLDATSGQIAPPFVPTDDDQQTRNRVTAKQQDGASSTYELTSGDMSTAEIGIYDEEVTVSLEDTLGTLDQAGWRVNLGTVLGYRYPSLRINLARDPDLLSTWLTVIPGGRVQVTNLADALPGMVPDETVDLLVAGYTQSIGKFTWDVEMHCTPFQPWRVTELASDSGDTGELLGYLDTDGSTVAASADVGATSVSVATASGPLWSVTADDYPQTVEMDGVTVTVTAVAGASSPQTFTVSALTKALTAGDVVRIYRPTVLGI